MEPAGEQIIKESAAASPLMDEYGEAVDNESAYEILQQRAAKEAEAQDAAAGKGAGPAADGTAAPAERAAKPAAKTASKDEGFFQNPAVKSFLRSAGTVLGREITRGLFGTRRRR